MPRRIVIIGGGAIGSATALFLRHADPAAAVVVVERDPTYAKASSALSASSIRQQFSSPINIRLSQFGVEFLRQATHALAVGDDKPALGFVEGGYLYLATPQGCEALAANHRVQQEAGAEVLWLSPDELRTRHPWIATDDLGGAVLGVSGEGWFDGYALTRAMRRKAQALGATYLQAEVAGLTLEGGRVVAAATRTGPLIEGEVFVNAAGPWARVVAAMAGVDLPVHARRRTVFVLSCPVAIPRCPLVIDPSGLWFRPEGSTGTRFLCGASPAPGEADPDDLPLEPDLAQFEERLWPALARRVPGFAALRVESAWAGYYEMNTFDHNGIVGAHPEVANLLFANGFSGHGIQHAPGIGRALAELIAHGAYRSIDISALGFERVLSNSPFTERNVI
ncbi:MAG: NAD(P)/FAD-dependent oxidoreductase [Burkholderiales bacterium]